MQVKRADNISGIRDPGYDRPSVNRQVIGSSPIAGATLTSGNVRSAGFVPVMCQMVPVRLTTNGNICTFTGMAASRGQAHSRGYRPGMARCRASRATGVSQRSYVPQGRTPR
jgi:hypothetical protein